MSDRRHVDDLSIDELQRVLAEKKRAARDARLARYRSTGRAMGGVPVGQLPEGFGPGRAAPLAGGRPPRRWFGRALLGVELLAVVGLLVVLYMGVTTLNRINAQAGEAIAAGIQGVPTLPPTPMITAVVLPSGHTPPTSPGGAQPNEAEIPANLRPLVQSLPAPAVPTQGPQQAQRIVIPSINVDAPIVQGDTWEPLKKGVGQHIGSADPGRTGNHVLSAHNDIFGEIFRNLDQLQPGDTIQVQTMSDSYTYIVTETLIVEPTQVEVLAPTEDPTITLISCYPYLVNTQRIVVRGILQATGTR
jgi:sortase A